ncbi:SGNH/GDSL hydrolase family protein [Streptomyces capparidis]
MLAAVLVAVGFVDIDRTDPAPTAAAPGAGAAAEPASAGRWVGTWSASPAAAEPGVPRGLPGVTIRNVVHVSVGGSAARVRLSNAFGDRPLRLTRATVAVAAAPSSPAAADGTLRELRFGQRPGVTVPPGGAVVSDPVALRVPAASDLLVTTYAAEPSGAVTYHPFARQTSYLAAGDHAADPRGAAFTERTPYWRYLSGVDVWSAQAEGSVVVLGDSITDGTTSAPSANYRWTDFLATRLLTTRGAPRLGVLNQGISGNRVLLDAPARSPANGVSGLRRLERDVLSRRDASALVVVLGINDILKEPRQTDPRRITEGLRRITERARARGLRVVGATLMPFRGHRGWGPGAEAVRQAVNAEIRAGGVFDAVADFDRALRDPGRPARLHPLYDSGDHIHPSDAGYRAMAAAFDLDALRTPAPAAL